MKFTLISALVSCAVCVQARGMLFAAKVDGKLRNLYKEEVDDGNYVLGYGNLPFAQPFSMEGQRAYAGKQWEASYVGPVDDYWMGFGEKLKNITAFKFDKKNKVINQNFYACPGLAKKDEGFETIFTRISYSAEADSGCVPVEIHRVPLLV